MVERDAVGVQAKRGIIDRERLRFADGAIGEIRRVANDREAEMPEMHLDLIRAPCTFARKRPRHSPFWETSVVEPGS